MIDRCYIEITNTCNLNCDFCPKHHRRKRQLSAGEFNLLTDRVRGKVSFLYFHLMGEPLLHPLLPQFIRTANEKGFKTVLTSNGTLLHRCLPLLEALPHKIQLSLHSHESNARGELAGYMQEVMQFSVQAAEKGTCMVLRLWNQGGRDKENEEVMRLIEQYVPKPWKERPDGFRLSDHLYLEFDRKFEWPTAGEKSEENLKDESKEESENESGEKSSKKEKKQLLQGPDQADRRPIRWKPRALLPRPRWRCGAGQSSASISRRNSRFAPGAGAGRRLQASHGIRKALPELRICPGRKQLQGKSPKLRKIKTPARNFSESLSENFSENLSEK